MPVTKKNIEELNTIGASKIESLFSNAEMLKVEEAIEEVVEKPSPMCDVFERDENNKPLFFNDFNNWRRFPNLKEICLSKNIGESARKILESDNAYLFHDHLIVKNKGASEATPWHIDKTYFMLDGDKTVSFWIPNVDVEKEESLRFASGSHLEKKLLMPKGFKDSSNLESSNEFLPFENKDIDDNYETVSWDTKRGDAIAFTFYTVHSAPAINFSYDRQVLSIRLFGDGATFDSRVTSPAPPFTKMGYKSEHGEPLSEKWFPRIA